MLVRLQFFTLCYGWTICSVEHVPELGSVALRTITITKLILVLYHMEAELIQSSK